MVTYIPLTIGFLMIIRNKLDNLLQNYNIFLNKANKCKKK